MVKRQDIGYENVINVKKLILHYIISVGEIHGIVNQIYQVMTDKGDKNMALKQVFIVNQDLKMGKGKIAVQVAHGEVLYMNKIADAENMNLGCDLNMQFNFKDWMQDGLMKKIVLKTTQEEMLILLGCLQMLNGMIKSKVWHDIVFDRGLTQVPADSMTCIVIEPLDEQHTDHMFGHLKLL